MTEREPQKQTPFTFNHSKKEEVIVQPMPPVWCSSICRNSMNEMCIEHCAIKRDTSYFEPKPDLKLEDMPRFPDTKGMTKEERFTSVTIYLAKVVDHLQGVPDEHATVIIRRPSYDTQRSSPISEVVEIKDILSSLTPSDTSSQDR